MSSSEWETCKLGDVCVKIGSGATPRGGKEVYSDGGPVALIRSQNVLDFSFSYDGLAYIDEDQANQLSNVEIEPDDVLLNITGDSVARVCQVTDALLPARVNQHVAIIRPDNTKVNAKYLKYYLLNPRFKSHMLALASVGGTRKALTKGMIEGFDINLPPLPTQKRIAWILSAFDEKIELNRQTNATLEAIAQAIFREWFVNFNYPVLHYDLDDYMRTMRVGGENHSESGNQTNHSTDMVEGEMGLMPAGWRVGTLGEVCNINMGQSPPGTSYNQIGNGVCFFQGKAEFGFRFPTIDKFTTDPKKFADKFDTLLSVRAPVGTINMARERCCIGRGLAAIQGKNNAWSFAFYLLRNLESLFNSYEGTGTVFGSINKAELESITIVIPPTELIDQFERLANEIDGLIYSREEESATLAQIRDALLPKLMRGEIV